jgi:hypothetical protein
MGQLIYTLLRYLWSVLTGMPFLSKISLLFKKLKADGQKDYRIK